MQTNHGNNKSAKKKKNTSSFTYRCGIHKDAIHHYKKFIKGVTNTYKKATIETTEHTEEGYVTLVITVAKKTQIREIVSNLQNYTNKLMNILEGLIQPNQQLV